MRRMQLLIPIIFSSNQGQKRTYQCQWQKTKMSTDEAPTNMSTDEVVNAPAPLRQFSLEDHLRVKEGTHTGFSLPHLFWGTIELHFTLLLCISCSTSLPASTNSLVYFCVK